MYLIEKKLNKTNSVFIILVLLKNLSLPFLITTFKAAFFKFSEMVLALCGTNNKDVGCCRLQNEKPTYK